MGHICRQAIGRHRIGIIQHACADWSIGVAFLELNGDFLANARNRDHAPVLTGPGHDAPHPTRRGIVLFADAVPIELNLDATVFIGVYFITRRAGHNGSLKPQQLGPRRDLRRAEWLCLGNDVKDDAVGILVVLVHRDRAVKQRLFGFLVLVIGFNLQVMHRMRQQIFHIIMFARMVLHLEGLANAKGTDVTGTA